MTRIDDIILYLSIVFLGLALYTLPNNTYYNTLILLTLVSSLIYTYTVSSRRLRIYISSIRSGFIHRRILYPLYSFSWFAVFKPIITYTLFLIILYGVIDPSIYINGSYYILYALTSLTAIFYYTLFLTYGILLYNLKRTVLPLYLSILLTLAIPEINNYFTPLNNSIDPIDNMLKILVLLSASLILLLLMIASWWYVWRGR